MFDSFTSTIRAIYALAGLLSFCLHARSPVAGSPIRLSPLGSPRQSLQQESPSLVSSRRQSIEQQLSPSPFSPSRMSPLSSPAKSLETELPLYDEARYSVDATGPKGPRATSPRKHGPNRLVTCVACFTRMHSLSCVIVTQSEPGQC